MEEWQLDFEWLRVRHLVKDAMKADSLPDLNSLLILIGIQEVGRWKKEYSKEEKQDLMHVAVCQLLSSEGFYEFEGRDEDGYPHYRLLKSLDIEGVKTQETLLKQLAIQYLDTHFGQN